MTSATLATTPASSGGLLRSIMTGFGALVGGGSVPPPTGDNTQDPTRTQVPAGDDDDEPGPARASVLNSGGGSDVPTFDFSSLLRGVASREELEEALVPTD